MGEGRIRWIKYDSLGKRNAARVGGQGKFIFSLYVWRGGACFIGYGGLGQRVLMEAMHFGAGLADKNALFTARYNYAYDLLSK
jgi:hypothetical protein